MSGACYVGMDVSQATVDVAVLPGTGFHIANNDQGIAEAVTRVQALEPTLILLEATGGLEVPLAGALAGVGLPGVVVYPRQVRDFARATDSWRRRIGWTPPSAPGLRTPCTRRSGRSLMRTRRRWRRWWRADGS